MNLLQVLLSVQSKGTEAVGALQRSVNSLTSGIRARAEAVQKFNRQISNGEAALRQWGAVAAAAFSVSAMRTYMREAEQADKVQRKLLQALKQTGQADGASVLEHQQSALQRVTNATDDQISVVQRLMVQNGLSVDQTLAMTESVLDFAEATGQSYESAAALVGKSLRDNGEELGRYNLRLDGSKDRYTALREAIAGYAGGQARAAVVDKQAHAARVDLAEAGERIGRALNTIAGPILQALVPAVETLADWITRAVATMRPFSREIGLAVVAIASISAVAVAGSAAFKLWLAVVNPLRLAFVALAGTNFANLSKLIGDFGALQSINLMGWGQRAAAGLSLVGAALAGWSFGKILNELEVGGLKVETWVARVVNLFYLWAELTGAAAEKAWTWLKFRFLNRLEEGKLMVAEFADFVASTLNRVLRRDLIPRDGLKAAIDSARAELGKLSQDEEKAFAVIEARMAQAWATRGAWDRFIVDVDGQDLSKHPPKPEKEGGGGTNPLQPGAGQLSAELAAKIELEQKRLLFDLETKIAQARAKGDQARVDDLTRTRDEMQMLLDLGGDQLELVNRRLDANKALQDQERARAEEERTLSQQLGDIARDRALIEADRYLTEEQKQAALLPLLKEENKLISDRIALLEKELLLGATDERRGQILQQLDQLRGKQADTTAGITAAQPQSILGGMMEGVVGWMSEVGSVAKQVGSIMKSTIGAAVDSVSRGIYGLITRTMTWKEALSSVGQAILGTLLQAIIQLGVRTLAVMMLNAVAGKAIAAAQTAALIPIAAAQSAIWATPAALATIASFGGAAAQAPLAIAGSLGVTKGLVAALSFAGYALGGFTGIGPENKPAGVVHAGEWVAPKWMVEDERYAPLIGLLEGARTRGYSLGGLVSGGMTLAGALDAGISRPYQAPAVVGGADATGATGIAPKITVINIEGERAATRIARRSAAAGDIVYIVRNNRAQIFGSGE